MSFHSQSLPANCQTCQVCGVSIDAEGKVYFNYGPPGSRERLYARVCRFAASAGCINAADYQITGEDSYGTAGLGTAGLGTAGLDFGGKGD